MPIYEYRCLQCDHKFDLFHPIGEDPGPCPWCLGPVRRVFSPIGVIFKGSGFHSTDYRKPTPKDEEAPKAPASESASKASKESASEHPSKGSAPGKDGR